MSYLECNPNHCPSVIEMGKSLVVQELKINKLEQQKSELIEKFKDLLDDSKYLYQYDPNNFRKTEDEYFKSEIELLKKYEVKK